MNGRYEIKDAHYPAWRGMRFSSSARALVELSHAVPRSRFYVYDRFAKSRLVEEIGR